jgi:glycosyltransferase involved in cell wall biosynthesis
MNQGLISVILPVWKPNIKYLKKSIDSLLSQTYENIEIIISYKKFPDSDQAFYSLINQYHDTRIHVIEATVKGISSQLNEGILASNGEFISIINDDDFFEPTKLEKQLQFKKENNCDIVGSWGYYVTVDETKKWKILRPIQHDNLRKIIMSRTPLLHVSVLMDRKIFEKTGLYNTDFVYAVDYELWFRVMQHGFRFGNVPEFLVGILYNPTSISRKYWQKQRFLALKARYNAFFHQGFHKPQDLLYFIQSHFFVLISPNFAMKIRRLFKTA